MFLSPKALSPQILSEHAAQVTHQRLCWPELQALDIDVYLRRDDIASAHYPGNKYYKLFYNLAEVMRLGCRTVVSFGGAYSNHIHALAIMGKQYGIQTVGIIRGHSPARLSPTLQDAYDCGMQLVFLDKQRYKTKDITDIEAQWSPSGESYYLLPEGGENRWAVEGCRVIGQSIDHHFSQLVNKDYTVCCAVGTGTTMAGIITGLPDHIPCIGFSVLKGEDTLSTRIEKWLHSFDCSHQQWQLINDFHHGGYARVNRELLAFMQRLETENDVVLEPVYSAKMLWGIERLAKQGRWAKGTRLVVVHGGGIQGRRGFGL